MKRVFDEFTSQVWDKPDPDIIIASALGTLLVGFVGFVAGGIWRHVSKKGRPKHNTQQKRAAQAMRKRQAKHARAT